MKMDWGRGSQWSQCYPMGVRTSVEIFLLLRWLEEGFTSPAMLRINPIKKKGGGFSTSFQMTHQTSILVKNMIIII